MRIALPTQQNKGVEYVRSAIGTCLEGNLKTAKTCNKSLALGHRG